jgi:transposase
MPLFSPMPRPPTLAEAWGLLAEQAQTIARLEAENAALRAEQATLRAEVETLRTLVGTLQAQVQALAVRVGQNSSNSSKPPSSDPPSRPPRPARPPTGRPSGAQPGHVGHGRGLRPPDEVDRVVVGSPVACGQCGTLLLGEDTRPERRQVTELPVVRPAVVEYQRHTLTCLACGQATGGVWPAGLPPGAFGPRVAATVGYLTGRLGVSQRDAVEALDALFGTAVSVGSIAALEQTVSAALAEPVAAAQTYVQRQPVANVDETSWREGARKGWLWIGVTELVTVFLVLATRGAAGAKQVLGETYAGLVGSDRWSAYTWLRPERRQVCWAHLRRDFESFVAWGGESAEVGRALLEQAEQLFQLWYRVRDGTLSRSTFQVAMQPIMVAVGRLLREGTTRGQAKPRGTCRKILEVEVALWTFVREEGVEPTNNAAERPLRRAVLWRRRCFGTQSEAGSRFVERVLTAVTTLRQQGRDVLDYLTAACVAANSASTPPSLLPTAETLAPAA